MKIIYANEAKDTPSRVQGVSEILDTPVARFARSGTETRQSRFSELIPLSVPTGDEQYAFEVDLDRCTGCKACVAACHSLNGLMDEETWRDVGLLKGGKRASPYQQTVTTACHHCVEPGCLDGCPVDAYEKDPTTGIVTHLDDQCIGCQYCVLKCPYDVPKYNEKLGIVRKCDMCHLRLAEGEAPACVQACPTEAIRITKVSRSALTIRYRGNPDECLLPGTVTSSYTLPTTRYLTKKIMPLDTKAGDHAALQPQHAHWPLILMLTLTQASVGTLFFALLTGSIENPYVAGASVAWCMAGLTASIFHLGKPLKAWRAFIGFGHSWLSREIVIFGVYFPLLAALLALPFLTDYLPMLAAFSTATKTLAPGAFAAGLAGVFCSVMIYHDTRRPFWNWQETGIRFLGTAWIVGGTTLLQFVDDRAAFLSLALAILVGVVTKLASEAKYLWHSATQERRPTWKTARLLQEKFGSVTFTRYSTAVFGSVVCPTLSIAFPTSSTFVLALGLALLVLSEVCERYLYFTTVAPFKMPGGMSL